MPTKRTAAAKAPASTPRAQYFVKELPGETPPSFQTLQQLYKLASELFGMQPWHLIDETNLIVVRDSVSGELCYCCVMGSLGEVLAMHAYIGTEGLRQFRRIEAEEFEDPAEFFASTHCVYVEFVPRAELQRQDKDLLAALGHSQGKGLASPIFRTMRPGFLPWFVTEYEARMLAQCIRATMIVCTAVAIRKDVNFWQDEGVYPLVTHTDGAETPYRIEEFEAILPPEPPVAPARLPEETLFSIRRQDYAVRGVMELDLMYSAAAIGKKGQRNSCALFAMAIDAQTGTILAPEAADSSVAAGDMLARVFLKAVQPTRTLPREVRVRSQKFKESLTPLMESLGVTIRVADRLPASDEARSGLLSFLN